MKTKTILSALGAALLSVAPSQLCAETAEGGVTVGLTGERGAYESGQGKPSAAKYEVPLLEIPAFLDAAAATNTGGKVLLRPADSTEFWKTLGGHYWSAGENGWLSAFGAEGGEDRRIRTLGRSIDFAAMPMSDGPAVPAVIPMTPEHVSRLAGRDGLFVRSGAPNVVDPDAQIGWLGDTGLGASGGWVGGAFLLVAIGLLLFSQLAGSQKGRRRRRTSSRRRRSA